MRKLISYLLVFFIFVVPAFLPSSFAQDVPPEYAVRVVYFLAQDSQPHLNAEKEVGLLMRDIQQFVADEMEHHGFGRKTFRLETEELDRVVVHRVTGKFLSSHYALPSPIDCADEVMPEIYEHFDRSKNIYCVIANLHRETCGVSDGGSSHSGWGLAVLSGCDQVSDIFGILTHELLHAFGAPHDYRTAGVMSYGWSHTFLSFSKCLAKRLDVHRSFNSNPTEVDTTPTTIKVLPSLVHPPNAIRLRFELLDADGLHQAQLNGIPKPGTNFGPSLIACKSLSGTSATIEFITSDLKRLPDDDYNQILSVIDKHGNFTNHYFPIREFVGEGVQSGAVSDGGGVRNADARIPVLLRKVSGDNQQGVPNSWLPQPLVVEVLDANGDPVVDVEVLFRVTGYPEESFPEGEIRTDYGVLSDPNPRTDANGRAQSLLRLGYQSYYDPVVHVGAVGVSKWIHFTGLTSRENVLINLSEYPDMFWIETLKVGGALYGPDGSIGSFGNRVKSIAFDGLNRQLYSTQIRYQEGRYCGAIYRSPHELSSFDLIEIVKLRSPSFGIAIAPLTGKLYWTNFQGDIQTCHLDGSNVQTLITGLNSPKHIAVDTAGSKLYWTDGQERILQADLNGKNIQTFAESSAGTLGHITVAGDHLYWTEKVSWTDGKIRRANLQTTDIQRVIALGDSAPVGIAVDGTGSKLYWTDTQGRIRRANFNGTDIEDVATGLIAPGQLIFGIHVTKDEERAYPAWDTNTDGITNVLDLILVAQHLGEDASANPQADVNGDGTINVLDLIVVAQNLGEPNAAGAPSNFAIETLELDPVMIQTWIAQAEAENDRSLAFRHGIENLRHLLASLLPEDTALLPNYPNPFNPETWIPYHLAEPADVTVRIYAADGALVRMLVLGHQAAGIYESRTRAAYWGGKNEVGEPVASGVYFYTLTAGDFMTTRKMLIRK